MAEVIHIVQLNDTVHSIAEEYQVNANDIIRLNGIMQIDGVYYITVGQKLVISGKSANTHNVRNMNYNDVVITQFGQVSDANRTMVVCWNWSRTKTSHFEVKWLYNTGGSSWFIGDEVRINGTSHSRVSTYTFPKNAKQVMVKIRPFSYLIYPYGIATSYWTVGWTSSNACTVNVEPLPTPSIPSVSIKNYTMTAKVEGYTKGSEMQFQIIQNDNKIYKSGIASISEGISSYSCYITDGNYYKVRCRSRKYDVYSEWSEYTNNHSTKPGIPTEVDSIATSATSVRLSWKSSASATSYDIQYSTNVNAFNGSETLMEKKGVKETSCEMTGLQKGQLYYFRVRGVNDNGISEWSSIKTGMTGTVSAAPTTWSSTTGIIGRKVELSWIHNSKDNSKESSVELELTINGSTKVISLAGVSAAGVKHIYEIDTSSYADRTTVEWRVRTKGVVNEWGDWSIKRSIDLYITPTLVVNMLNNTNEIIHTLTAFPFYINAEAGPVTQKPINYHVVISSNNSYQSWDDFGNMKNISKGAEVYSKVFNIEDELSLVIDPSSVDLENNISYTVKCIVTMDSGLQAEDTTTFTVKWDNLISPPNAEILFDPETLSTNIRPYCDIYPMVFYEVAYNSSTGKYVRTNNILNDVDGTSVEGAYTEDYDDVVYKGTKYIAGATKSVYFCIAQSNIPELLDNITLSVYRKEYDGRFIEIGTGIVNTERTFVTDPHPSLDYARYRVIAINDISGEVSFSDIPGHLIGEKSVVIQWDEVWEPLDPTDETSLLENSSWAGSILKLPYNIDVSDSNSIDVSLINYIGRSHPVAYYGTQLGITSTWDMAIPKNDKHTLYALRRLMMYMGDVYVREPSGSGYWANIAVSFSQKHCEMAIPVSLEITRVEGGM